MTDAVSRTGAWHAHAKVNLCLEVGPVRADGYHPYVSHAMSVGVSDTVTVAVAERAAQGAVPTVAASTSTGIEDSLARHGAEIVLDAAGRRDVAVDVSIEKVIPVGAGLGGGSADAAAAMVAVATLLGRGDLPLHRLAAGVGTDVPFCVTGGCARLHGRGERVERMRPLPPVGVLVAVPPVHVTTGQVFAAFDETGPGPPRPDPDPWLQSLLPGCTFRNDLEAAAVAVRPELGEWKARIEAELGAPVRMTGSGAGFVRLAPDPSDLRPAVSRLAAIGVRAWATTPRAHGVERIR